MTISTIKPHNQYGWITGLLDGHWFEAQVLNEPSKDGINDGRIVQLSVSNNDTRDIYKEYLSQMLFHHNKGLVFDRCHPDLVLKIVQELEKLQLLESPLN